MSETAAITISNVKKSFKDLTAVKGVSFSVKKGEYCALLGPNGAGKTTLMEMIEGIQNPDEGTITINGKNWKSDENYLHQILGIALQETHFFEKLKVKEMLDVFASFYDLEKTRSTEVLGLVNLIEKQDAYVKNLSGGQRQRLSLGIALINRPEILLLDEPTTGLDPGARREVWEILFRLKKEQNITMILTTHYMEEADFLCERIIIMDKGNVLADGSKDQLVARNQGAQLIEFSIDDAHAERFNLEHSPYKGNRDPKSGKWSIKVDDIVSSLPGFLSYMQQQQIGITSLECRKMTLEDVFISMTGRRLSE